MVKSVRGGRIGCGAARHESDAAVIGRLRERGGRNRSPAGNLIVTCQLFPGVHVRAIAFSPFQSPRSGCDPVMKISCEVRAKGTELIAVEFCSAEAPSGRGLT